MLAIRLDGDFPESSTDFQKNFQRIVAASASLLL